MAKKRSEQRKHTAMVRIDEEARRMATQAAGLKDMSLADYLTDMVKKVAGRDLDEWAAKRAAAKPKGGKT